MQTLAIQLSQIFIVKDNFSFGRLVKCQDGFHQARFSASAFADNGNRFALMYIECHARRPLSRNRRGRIQNAATQNQTCKSSMDNNTFLVSLFTSRV